MQIKFLLRYLSSAPILIGVWLTLTGFLWIAFNYIFPDLLFHPMP